MSKKITLGTKPRPITESTLADDWVENRNLTEEPMKRLTLDIPASLHRQIKAKCALNGKKIVEELRELLLQNYGKP